MLSDKRIEILAKNLVGYSCDVQKGENVLISASGCDYQLVAALVREVYARGGRPYVEWSDNRIKREILKGLSEEQVKEMCEIDLFRMKRMQAFIGIRGGENSYELSDVAPDKMQLYYKGTDAVQEQRVNKTKWVVLRYPTQGMSQLAGMSTEAFEDYYFNVCNLDYAKMDRAMDSLKELMDKTDRVRITGKGTDLTFSIKGIGAVKCSGLRNIPDGEVYSAPVKESVNGVIAYNVPSIENGLKFENVTLKFKDGKIIDISANFQKEAEAIFNTDEGARYVGEFSLGVNPYITKPIGDILFDEKISGSIHFTPGNCYEDAYNGNKSSVHWDLVFSQAPEYGGGEIYFDDMLIRKDGRFVIEKLFCLNPENLK